MLRERDHVRHTVNRLQVFEQPSKYIAEPHELLAVDGTPLDVLLDAACPGRGLLGLVPALLDWLSDPAERALVRARILPTIGSSAIAPVLMCPDDLDLSCTGVARHIVQRFERKQQNVPTHLHRE